MILLLVIVGLVIFLVPIFLLFMLSDAREQLRRHDDILSRISDQLREILDRLADLKRTPAADAFTSMPQDPAAQPASLPEPQPPESSPPPPAVELPPTIAPETPAGGDAETTPPAHEPDRPANAAAQFRDMADTEQVEEPFAAAPDAEASASSPTEPPSEPPQEPGRNLADIEKRFGTQWVVWVGGLALALGGIFLIRYSIEQGYFGPGTRVMLGALLAIMLVGAGELTRRQEIRLGITGAATAHIPGILTAAGTTVAYATVYGAYALYEFLSPAIAFVLLGAVALATLAAALVHGPALAGLGLIGAFVTPLLVSTTQPSYWTLYIYLSVVTAAALVLARFRLWRWLAVTAIAFSIFWMFIGIYDNNTAAIAAHAFYAVAGFALSALFIVAGFFYGPPNEYDEIDPVSSGALAGFLLGSFMLVLASRHDMVALVTFAALAASTAVVAQRTASATWAMATAATFATLVIVHWSISGQFEHWQPISFDRDLFTVRIEALGIHLVLAAFFAALFGVGAFLAQGRFERVAIPIWWASVGVLVPIVTLIALYYRITEFSPSIPFAGIALLIAALFAFATETLSKRALRPGIDIATAIIAAGAAASLALTLAFALERGALTIGLALMAPGIAFVAEKRPLPILRNVIGAVVVLVLARIAWEPRIVGDEVGATPIFNWLLYGYGVPALSFWVAGTILRKRADDLPARMTDSAAILFTVLLLFLEIRHLVYDGDVYHPGTGLAELALQVSTGLATTIGLERIHARTGSIVHDFGARIIGGLAFAGIVFGLAYRHNPMLTGDPVGGLLFNLILLGYGLPAALMAVLARIFLQTRPKEIYLVAAVTAMVLALAYLTLEVRTLFHGTVLTLGPTTDAEQYTYSAVWLAFGVALLLAGIAIASQPARLGSAATVILTTAKVFLYDLAGIQGVYRAFSFIGLGIVLIGIGLLYQRLLFPSRRTATAATAPPE